MSKRLSWAKLPRFLVLILYCTSLCVSLPLFNTLISQDDSLLLGKNDQTSIKNNCKPNLTADDKNSKEEQENRVMIGVNTAVENITDLIIAENTTIKDRNLIISGNITIKTKCTLYIENTTISFNTTANAHEFLLENLTTLKVNSSTLTTETENERYFITGSNSIINITSSTINQIGILGAIPREMGIYTINSSITLDQVTFSNIRNTALYSINSSKHVIQSSDFSNGQTAIRIINSKNVIIHNNSFSQFSMQTLIFNNVTNAEVTFNSGNQLSQDLNYEAISVDASKNIMICDNTLICNGITLLRTNFSSISRNSLTDSTYDEIDYGIRLLGCQNLSITYNTLAGVTVGMNIIGAYSYSFYISNYLQYESANCILEANKISTFSGRGIEIRQCNGYTVKGNTIERGSTVNYPTNWEDAIGAGIGIYLNASSKKENIFNNTFSKLAQATFFDRNSSDFDYSDTLLYLNNFKDNTRDYNITNVPLSTIWTVAGRGNYWKSFSGTDIDGNGIIDQEKVISGNLKDYAPLYYPNERPLVTVTSTPDYFIENGVNKYLNYTIDDEDPMIYKIWRNGSLIENTALNGSKKVDYLLDGLVSAYYNITFQTIDRWENNYVVVSLLTIEPPDTTAPLLLTPNNITLRELEPEKQFSFNASDLHPTTYTHKLYNSSGIMIKSGSGNWDSKSNITIKQGNLREDNYTWAISVFDVLNQHTDHNITIYVIDDGPVIVCSTTNRSLGQDSGTYRVTWHLYDAEPSVSQLFINNTLNVTYIGWTSGSPISWDFNTNQSLGLYMINMVANDTESKQSHSSFNFTIVDNTFPTIQSYGSNPAAINQSDTNIYTFWWNATDRNPVKYNIEMYYYDNQTENSTWENVKTGIWVGQNLDYQLNASLLPLGNYQLRASATDRGNNTAYSTGGQFSINDNVTPVLILHPGNQTLEYGYPAPLLQWNFTDRNPETYYVTVNNTLRATAVWNDTIEFVADKYLWNNNTALANRLGIYKIMIIVQDQGNNRINNSIWIIVQDTINPNLFNYSSSVTFYHYTIGDNYTVVASDIMLDHSEVRLDGIVILTQSYENITSSNITIFYKQIPIGYHLLNYTIYDIAANNLTVIIAVTLIDPEAPLIQIVPSNISKYWPDNMITFVYKHWDIRPASFFFYHNNTLIDKGEWTSTIYIASLPLTIGIHIFRMVVSDTSGHNTTSWVKITMIDRDDPIIVSIQPEATLNLHPSEFIYLDCIATDINPAGYRFLLNGTSVLEGNWTNIISFNVMVNKTGYFIWTLEIWDKSMNTVSISNDLFVSPPVIDDVKEIHLPGRTLIDDIALIAYIVFLVYMIKYIIRGIKFAKRIIKAKIQVFLLANKKEREY